ncbi:tenascin [Uranotaenia lowii]|uniref:tenascin n=1 Tax=Uranotaenia lowii TaxID=190385 RepID=UPI002478D9DF|nr:tenascin [Uranotaenia lowii]
MRRYLILLAAVFLVLLGSAKSSDIIDVDCQKDQDCDIFKSSSANSTCMAGNCTCTDLATGNKTECVPRVIKASNLIGGQCPCLAANSLCNEKTNFCVCKEGYLPSRDAKRCIGKSVALGGICEVDEQCIQHDHFSHCDDKHLNCSCLAHFTSYQDTCHSIIAPPSGDTHSCEKDEDCSKITAHTVCHEKQCICSQGFVANAESNTCLAVTKFEGDCIDSNQCIAQLGVGSVCNEGKCMCNDLFFPFPVHAQENATKEEKIATICKRKISHGASCNDDKECYQFHRGPHEQTMECYMSECVCSEGFIEKEGICLGPNGGSSVQMSSMLALLATVIVFVIY